MYNARGCRKLQASVARDDFWYGSEEKTIRKPDSFRGLAPLCFGWRTRHSDLPSCPGGATCFCGRTSPLTTSISLSHRMEKYAKFTSSRTQTEGNRYFRGRIAPLTTSISLSHRMENVPRASGEPSSLSAVASAASESKHANLDQTNVVSRMMVKDETLSFKQEDPA